MTGEHSLRQAAAAAGGFARREPFLTVLFLLFLVLHLAVPCPTAECLHAVDAHTIFALTALLVTITAMWESGFLDAVARRLLNRMHTERGLALALLGGTALSATVLTNDIALFAFVPLTLSLQSRIEEDLGKLIVFEAIAANVGSALTPIGNPQNLYLWGRWGLSFVGFVQAMAVPVAAEGGLLAGAALLLFRPRPLTLHLGEAASLNLREAVRSLLLLLAAVVLIERGMPLDALAVVLLVTLIARPSLLGKVDWAFLLLFCLMFVDLHLVARLPWIAAAVQKLPLDDPRGAFLCGVAFSQGMSNVPAAIFLSKFTTQWRALTWGVNVGGNGIVIGSLANLIALRFADDRRLWATFHRYAVPFLLLSVLLVTGLL